MCVCVGGGLHSYVLHPDDDDDDDDEDEDGIDDNGDVG